MASSPTFAPPAALSTPPPPPPLPPPPPAPEQDQQDQRLGAQIADLFPRLRAEFWKVACEIDVSGIHSGHPHDIRD
ncbi:hypothetical protein LY76DRAFT_651028 [Colletotrichum caudatum]|nr:hypothetical protein LY76DRAFT_651028 [Colletotrichum caudatum]